MAGPAGNSRLRLGYTFRLSSLDISVIDVNGFVSCSKLISQRVILNRSRNMKRVSRIDTNSLIKTFETNPQAYGEETRVFKVETI